MIYVYPYKVRVKVENRVLIRKTVAAFLFLMLLLLNAFSTVGAYIELCHHTDHNPLVLSQCNQLSKLTAHEISHEVKIVNHVECSSSELDHNTHEILYGVTDYKKLKLLCGPVKYSLEVDNFAKDSEDFKGFIAGFSPCSSDFELDAIRSVCLII
ncbi:MAG: hypothetical protein ACQETH_11485 [Candidatus Rifleibacteriota bacterium]